MPLRQAPALAVGHAARLAGIVLASAFAVETTVMLALPRLLPAGSGELSSAVLDACLLTAVLIPLLWCLLIRPVRRLAQDRLELLNRVLSAQDDERRRIAADLHDGLGQSLTGLLIGLRAIEESASEDAVRAQARELRQQGGSAHEDVRRLVRGLHPTVLDDLGLRPALERLIDDLRATAPMAMECQLGDEPARLPREVETALYRIAQEALTNVVRHSGATCARLTLQRQADWVELAITDDGRGFESGRVLAAAGGDISFGLVTMRDRAAALGGWLTIEASPGRGTRVVARLPLAPAG